MSTVLPASTVYYPESDGKPMAETDRHRHEMTREIDLLSRHFEGRKSYVTGNLLVYYVEGDVTKSFSPDVMVVHGVEPRFRNTYKIWEELTPDVVIEVTSKKTKRRDRTVKPKLYASLGIRELFLFDPTQDYLRPPLQGYRLVDGEYQRLEPDTTGALVSEELELSLRVEQGELVFRRLDTGERLLTTAEVAALAQRERDQAERERDQAEKKHQAEREARLAAEAELARLKELLRQATTK